jgi:hypothetical protein
MDSTGFRERSIIVFIIKNKVESVMNKLGLSSKSFIHQQMHYLLILENTKIYIKT